MTAAQRMAQLRKRQRTAGLVTLTLVVPDDDVAAFARLAARRRALHGGSPRKKERTMRWRELPAAALPPTSISPVDILAFRELLETTAVTLAIRRMNPLVARQLRAAIEAEAALPSDAPSPEFHRLHLLLGKLSGDEPLQLLLRIALQLTDERTGFRRSRGNRREAVVARVKRLHGGIVDAVIDRNEALAVRRMRRYLSGLKEWLE
jgi:DNA-binding FadR family transcriptional regulator